MLPSAKLQRGALEALPRALLFTWPDVRALRGQCCGLVWDRVRTEGERIPGLGVEKEVPSSPVAESVSAPSQCTSLPSRFPGHLALTTPSPSLLPRTPPSLSRILCPLTAAPGAPALFSVLILRVPTHSWIVFLLSLTSRDEVDAARAHPHPSAPASLLVRAVGSRLPLWSVLSARATPFPSLSPVAAFDEGRPCAASLCMRRGRSGWGWVLRWWRRPLPRWL